MENFGQNLKWKQQDTDSELPMELMLDFFQFVKIQDV
jgi:hypothetical protein